jgi:hypothetical protein
LHSAAETLDPILDGKNAKDSFAKVSSSKGMLSQQDKESSLIDENGKRAIENERDYTFL